MNQTFLEVPTTSPPSLLAWCSRRNNMIDIVNFNTGQSYASFNGVNVEIPSYLGKINLVTLF